MQEMSEAKIIRKIIRNLMSPQVNDPITVERERNARKKIAAQTDKITIVVQIELSHKIDTLTQGTSLPAIITTLPAIVLLTTQITPSLNNDNTPKSVIAITMIEMFLTNGTCETIPHTIITVEIVHRLLMLIHNAETHLMNESITLFLKKLPKKF